MLSSHKWLRTSILAASYGASSYILLTGVAMFMIAPGGGEYTLSVRLAPALYVLVAMIFDIDIAYIFYGTQPRRFIVALVVSLAVTAVGAFLLSLLMFRGHWWEIVK